MAWQREYKSEYPAAFMNHESVHAKNKDYDLALYDFSEIASLNPSCAVPCNRCGDYYIKKNFIDRAITDVRISCAAKVKRRGRTAQRSGKQTKQREHLK